MGGAESADPPSVTAKPPGGGWGGTIRSGDWRHGVGLARGRASCEGGTAVDSEQSEPMGEQDGDSTGENRRRRRRGATWVVGVLVCVVAAVVGVRILHHRHPAIDAGQFSAVNFRSTKADVERLAGKPGDGKAYTARVSGREETYDDCWYYTARGPKTGSSNEVVICFVRGTVAMTSSPF